VLGVDQPDQDFEVGVRYAGVSLQLLLDLAVDHSLGRDEGAPSSLLLLVQPPWFLHGRSVTSTAPPRCESPHDRTIT
jgi:hypothetical protein